MVVEVVVEAPGIVVVVVVVVDDDVVGPDVDVDVVVEAHGTVDVGVGSVGGTVGAVDGELDVVLLDELVGLDVLVEVFGGRFVVVGPSVVVGFGRSVVGGRFVVDGFGRSDVVVVARVVGGDVGVDVVVVGDVRRGGGTSSAERKRGRYLSGRGHASRSMSRAFCDRLTTTEPSSTHGIRWAW